MAETRRDDERESVERGKRYTPPSGKKEKVEFRIDAISTPKGDVPTVDTVKRVVDGLNMLESEMLAETGEVKEGVLLKVRDLDKDILSIKKLISAMAISFESTVEKLGDIESKLEKSSQIVESQRLESAELARYIGSITNNLRREFADYMNLLEKKVTEELRKTSNVEVPGLADFSAKLSELQNYLDRQMNENLKVAQETRKIVESLRKDTECLGKTLEDKLSSSFEQPDVVSKTLSSLEKAAKTIEGFVESQVEEVKESGSDSVPSGSARSPKSKEKRTENPKQ